MIPPNASIFLSKRWPTFLPITTPVMDKIKVTTPIIHDGVIISTFRKEKLRPTANASMLVAIDKNNKKVQLNSLFFTEDSSLKDSYIILPPITTKSPKAIQWSILDIKFLNPTPANQPIIGITP